jgi:hypothetical protein
MAFAGLKEPVELRTVARAHVIALRRAMERPRPLAATVRRKLSALSSLFDYLFGRPKRKNAPDEASP